MRPAPPRPAALASCLQHAHFELFPSTVLAGLHNYVPDAELGAAVFVTALVDHSVTRLFQRVHALHAPVPVEGRLIVTPQVVRTAVRRTPLLAAMFDGNPVLKDGVDALDKKLTTELVPRVIGKRATFIYRRMRQVLGHRADISREGLQIVKTLVNVFFDRFGKAAKTAQTQIISRFPWLEVSECSAIVFGEFFGAGQLNDVGVGAVTTVLVDGFGW